MGRDQKSLCRVGVDGFPMRDSWEKGSQMDFFLGRPWAEGPAPHWLAVFPGLPHLWSKEEGLILPHPDRQPLGGLNGALVQGAQ